jgi:hypothetical protein
MWGLVACTPVLVTPESSDVPVAPAETTIPAETPTSAPTQEAGEESMMRTNDEVAALAQTDLAERLGIPVDQVSVQEVRAVTWPDTSLGCPQPDMVYAQVTQPGLLIALNAGGQVYLYHSGAAQEPFLCGDGTFTTPRGDEMVPPPDSEID